MKLLTSVFPRNGRVLPAGGWFTLAVCAVLVTLEVAGRYATTDIHDGLAACALIAAGCAVAVRHRREPLPWINRLAALAEERREQRFDRRAQFRVGVTGPGDAGGDIHRAVEWLAQSIGEDDAGPVVNIKSLFTERCIRCHSKDGDDPKARKFPLETFEQIQRYTIVRTATAMSLTK